VTFPKLSIDEFTDAPERPFRVASSKTFVVVGIVVVGPLQDARQTGRKIAAIRKALTNICLSLIMAKPHLLLNMDKIVIAIWQS